MIIINKLRNHLERNSHTYSGILATIVIILIGYNIYKTIQQAAIECHNTCTQTINILNYSQYKNCECFNNKLDLNIPWEKIHPILKKKTN